MKLTTESLKKLVQEVLEEEEDDKEDGDVFPPPPDEESVESAEESLAHNQDIIRFYEEMDTESFSTIVREEILNLFKNK